MATDHLRDVDALAAMTRADLEAHAKALRTLHSITEALLSAGDLREGLTLAMEAVARLTRFPAVAFFLLNERERHLELFASRGFAESTLHAARRLPLEGSLSGIAVRQRELVTTGDVSRDERTAPAVRTQLADEGFTGAASVPLLLGDRVIGAMNLIYKGELGLAPHERRLVEWVGRVVAIGVDRHQARRAEQWKEFLSQASVALSSSLDYDATLAQVARLAAQSFADWCVVDLVEPGGGIRRVAGAHNDPAKAPLVDALVSASRVDPDAREGVARAIRTGETVIRARIRDDQLHPSPQPPVATHDPEHLRLLRELGVHAYMCVPLVARGRVLGSITFASACDEDPFGASDVEGAEMLAVRCALAIDNARLFREAADARSALAEEREWLAHAQKMEAIGRLAGGIAHDFNNMLAPILAFSALLRRDLGPEDRAYAGLREIQCAAERAASLTRQLLALSRRQVVAPRELDLNEVVQGIEPMLRRLVGEDVDLSVAVAPEPSLVLADPSQMDQILLNLVVNARDAMPRGGRLTIETANVSIDASGTSPGPEIRPGSYAVLTVSDTGVGMDAATRARVFEPFFTTKAIGAGTGLGLAIVYGIVKQCGGDVFVRSDPGHGARFDVYLPRRTAPADVDRAGALAPATQARPTETILLVEDDEMARGAARAILVDAGYTVLEARSGADALLLSEAHRGGLDLVLTDLVMPGMSGRDLVERVRGSRPDVSVMLMSGYIGDSLKRGEGIEPGTAYVEKPFTPEELTRHVRATLAARPRGGA